MNDLAGIEQRPTYLLPLDAIEPDPHQPRKHFDVEALQTLAASLQAEGQIQPILVRPLPDDPGRYLLVAGERRWRACALAGIPTVRAEILADADPARLSIIQLVENLQRQDLTLPETIIGCSALVEMVGLDEAAQRLGMSAPWVSQRATLAKACPKVRALIDAGKLGDVEIAHIAEQVLALDADEGRDILDRIADPDGWRGPLTRAKARQALQSAKQAVQRKKERAAEESKRKLLAEQEAARKAALKERLKAERAAGGAGPAEQIPLVPPPPAHESAYDRRRREQAERWIAIEPELKRLARESKKTIVAALKETVGQPSSGFAFHLGMRDGYLGYEPPAKAEHGPVKLEVRGHSHDAGLILDALAPDHEISINLRVPIDKLRQIEQITGKQIQFSEYAELKAKVAAAGAQRIRTIFAERQRKAQRPEESAAAAPEDTVRAFIATLPRTAGARLKAADAYAAYTTWCESNGRTPLSFHDNAYGDAWTAAGIDKHRLKTGVHYIDVALKETRP